MSPFLDFLFRAVLAEIELLSTVSAPSLEAKVHRGKAEATPPPWGGAPAIALRRKYDRAKDDDARREVVDEALVLLREGRYSKRTGAADMGTKEGRLMVGRDPRPASLLAYIYGFSTRHIHRLRAEARKKG